MRSHIIAKELAITPCRIVLPTGMAETPSVKL